MSASTRVLDLAVRRLADEPAAASHPTLDELAAYYHRSLQQAEAAAVQDHLVTCRECTARLLELDEIHEMGQEAVAPAGTPESDEAWARLQRSLAPAPPAPPRSLPARTRTKAPGWLVAAAAALLATSGALGWVALDLRGRVAVLEAPQLNTPIKQLNLGPVRGASQRTVVSLGPDDHRFTLVLDYPGKPPSFSDFEISVARADGGQVFRRRGLALSPTISAFTPTLTRRLMPDGDYDIEVSGIAQDREEVIARYRLTIATASTP